MKVMNMKRWKIHHQNLDLINNFPKMIVIFRQLTKIQTTQCSTSTMEDFL